MVILTTYRGGVRDKRYTPTTERKTTVMITETWSKAKNYNVYFCSYRCFIFYKNTQWFSKFFTTGRMLLFLFCDVRYSVIDTFLCIWVYQITT